MKLTAPTPLGVPERQRRVPPHAIVLTAITMVAFAANSILCRLALVGGSIDPATFTAVRLASGAAILGLVGLAGSAAPPAGPMLARDRGNGGSVAALLSGWAAPFMLFGYAIAFSFAYVSLTAGTGALMLFGSVQATMITAGLRSGERPHPLQWTGLVLALAGLGYLVSPGLAAPSLIGSVLMVTAGAAWGLYSLGGLGVRNPVAATTRNFVRAVPFGMLASAILWGQLHASAWGLWLAFLSGAVTSGLGYVLWYAALASLTATQAATVQLSVPVIAAAGGVLVLGEPVTWRLILSAILILGGVALALAGRQRYATESAAGPKAGAAGR